MSYIYMGQVPSSAAPVVASAPAAPAKVRGKGGLKRLAIPAGAFAVGAVLGWFAGCKK